MRKELEKEQERKNTEDQILDKLQSIEKRIESIETKLDQNDTLSSLVNEDQLFFGLALSLALLIVALPNFDIYTIFQSFGLTIPNTSGALTTKSLLAGFLIAACGFRYYAIFAKEETRKNQIRAFSVSSFLLSVYWLFFDFTTRGLGNWLMNINAFLLSISPLTMIVFSIVFGNLVERKWYRQYGFNQPFVAIIFAFVGVFILTAYDLSLVASFLLPVTTFWAWIIVSASIVITFVILTIYLKDSSTKASKE